MLNLYRCCLMLNQVHLHIIQGRTATPKETHFCVRVEISDICFVHVWKFVCRMLTFAIPRAAPCREHALVIRREGQFSYMARRHLREIRIVTKCVNKCSGAASLHCTAISEEKAILFRPVKRHPSICQSWSLQRRGCACALLMRTL